MPEPTFGHQPMTRDEARAEYLRMLSKMAGVEVPRVLVQPDDPGPYARTCLRCGLDEGLGENRLCTTCCPPAPWWASALRTVDERALLLRMWRRVKRFMARCAGEGM